MMHDRVRHQEFPVTHELLATMLGVRRPTITLIARDLQNAGIVSYRRGFVTIRNREALENASCECYRLNGALFEAQDTMESLKEQLPAYCWDFPHALKLAIRLRSDGELVLRIESAVSCLPRCLHLDDVPPALREDSTIRRPQIPQPAIRLRPSLMASVNFKFRRVAVYFRSLVTSHRNALLV